MAGAGHALEQALAYYRAPALLAMAAQRPLPEDVIELIRLAAGDSAQAAASAAASGEPPERVCEAAVFFVQQVMFAAGDDPHRVLGVNPGAPAARIREHYRWLVRWLHPDRNADDWDSVYTDRVTRAWQQLRRGGALAGEGEAGASDAAAEEAQDAEWSALAARSRPPDIPGTRLARVSRETDAAPLLSARTARRLPVFVLGGLGLAAVSLVALLWYTQQQKAARPAALSTAPVGGTSVPIPPPVPAPIESLGTEVPPTEAPAPLPPLPQPLLVGAPSGANLSPSVGEASVPTPPANDPPAPQPPVLRRARPARAVPVANVAAVGDPGIGTEVPPTAGKSVAAEVPAAAPVAGIEEAAAHAVLDRFTGAYAAGDINALMRLFTRDAVNNRGGREAIVYDYQSLFSQSRERRLVLVPNGWLVRDDGAVVLADYEAWVKEGRLLPGSTLRGGIRFTLRREDGELKISQVIHD